jgi:uncharacterized metal-binding protein YceD (DUF177 family)
MKIDIAGLPATGRELVFGLGEAWALAAATLSLEHPPDRLEGTVYLKRGTTTGVVVVDVHVRAAAPAPCDRCGEACEMVVEADSRLLYAPEESEGAAYDGLAFDQAGTTDATPAGGGGTELGPDDLDIGWYRDGQIDVADVLSEVLALETPPRVVCADSEQCDKRTDALLATARVADGPFAVLGTLKKRGSTADD